MTQIREIGLPFPCPGCGAKFVVPSGKMHGIMKCRHCTTRFFVDQSGNVALGGSKERDRLRKESTIELPIVKRRLERPKPKWLRSVEWVAAKPVSWIAVVAVTVGIAVTACSQDEAPTSSLPPGYKDRSQHIAKMLIVGDERGAADVAPTKGAKALTEWFRTKRTALKTSEQSLGPVKTIDVAVLFAKLKEGKASTTVSLKFAKPKKSKAEAPEIKLVLHWISGPNAAWLLDVDRTATE